MARLLLATRRPLQRITGTSVLTNNWQSRSFSSPVVDPSLVDATVAPQDFAPECAVVYRDFLTPQEGDMLVHHVLKRLSRRRYEKGHWDAVIKDYKEVELPDDMIEDQGVSDIFRKTRDLLEKNHLSYQPVTWLPCHVIDLKEEGELNPHVDSVKFSGDLVAGISLLSPSIMRLVPHVDGGGPLFDGHVELYLPPLSLYALTGVARYHYSHELLKNESIFTSPDGKSTTVRRDQRLSIIFRDSKRESS